MLSNMHFDPLRPNRAFGIADKYEFTHGVESVCVYDIDSLDFIKEIPVGERPDCHSTSVDNRYLYMACGGGLFCIDQNTLEMVKHLDTGHVYGVNMMPDGDTMLLHDAWGGIQVIKDVQDMDSIHVYKRLSIIQTGVLLDTLGGKGHFIENGRFYLCNGWVERSIFAIDLESDYSFDVFVNDPEKLYLPDDLVVSHDKAKAYSACYHDQSFVTVTDLINKKAIDTIRTGIGTCGLTMTNNERYVVASNDRDDSVSVIDTTIDKVVSTPCARKGFDRLGITGYIQGISIGVNDEAYVYGCSGNGALVRFCDLTGDYGWDISYPGGKLSSEDMRD